jgi:hypothetical protein
MMLYFSLFFSAHAQPYLIASNVESVILKEKDRFSSCSSLSDGLYNVRFSIDKQGAAQLQSGESCFADINNVPFPAHPTSVRVFVWKVASKEGVLYPQSLTLEKPIEILLPVIFGTEKQKIMELIQKEG